MKPVKNILLFSAAADRQVSVYFNQGTFWLSQKAMALLFGVDRTVITKHIKHVFESGELDEPSVCAIFAHTAEDGKNYQTQFYRLEAVLAVGYRVNSVQATDFRKWATQTLNEFIYAEADANKLYMGLTTWKDASDGKIQKSDVTVAKNYLSQQHIAELNRIVSAYLDLAENNAQRGMALNMQQWAKFLDGFLELSNYPILQDKGSITMLEAKLKAEGEFEKYRVIQDRDYESDFDKLVRGTKL
jgi:hypothetical protein